MRKWLACALTLSVLVTSAPVAAFAESDTNGYDIFPQGSVVREETLSEEDASESIDERDLINSGEKQIPGGEARLYGEDVSESDSISSDEGVSNVMREDDAAKDLEFNGEDVSAGKKGEADHMAEYAEDESRAGQEAGSVPDGKQGSGDLFEEELDGKSDFTVGNGVTVFTIGDGVTAELRDGILYLHSDGGTLWKDWQNHVTDENGEMLLEDYYSVFEIHTDETCGKIYLPEDSSGIFSNISNYYFDLSHFDTSRVKNMREMFANSGFDMKCLDLSNFDTSHVTDMSRMFVYENTLRDFGSESIDLSSFDTSNVTNMSSMFARCSFRHLDLSGFDTSAVTDMSSMFQGSGLKDLDLSGFDTSKVTDMSYMFAGSGNYYFSGVGGTLDLSHFDTSNVENMEGMFFYAEYLTDVNLSSFNTSKVTDMSQMFSECYSLTSLNLSNFDTSNIESCWDMFFCCSSLERLDISNFDIPSPWDLVANCSKLEVLVTPKSHTGRLNLPGIFYDKNGEEYYYYIPATSNGGFVVAKSQKMAELYENQGGSEYAEPHEYELGNGVTATFDPSDGTLSLRSEGGVIQWDWFYNTALKKSAIKVIRADSSSGKIFLPEDSHNLFAGFEYLEKIDLDKFDTSRVKNMSQMFYGCPKLREIALQGIDVSGVTDMSYMFCKCSSLESLDLRGLNTSNVTNMASLFYGCSSLKSLDLRGLDTSGVTSMVYMFGGCSSLGFLDISGFDTSRVNDMEGMFLGCEGLKNLDLSGFNTAQVEDMYQMFDSCSSLESLNVDGFDTSNVLNMDYMFWGCNSLKGIDLSGFNFEKCERMENMFGACTSLEYLDLSGFNAKNIKDISYMFSECRKIKYLDLSRFDMTVPEYKPEFYFLGDCDGLEILKTPKAGYDWMILPHAMYDKDGKEYKSLPGNGRGSIVLAKTKQLAQEYESTDKEIQVGDGVKALYEGSTGTLTFNSQGGTLWSDWADRIPVEKSAVKSISFRGSSGKVYLPKNSSAIFSGLSNIKSLNAGRFDTSKVTDMQKMFEGCSSLTGLNLTGFVTSGVTSMKEMFKDCISLQTVVVSGFDTSRVTNMDRMFEGCYSLKSLDLSSFDTSGIKTATFDFFPYPSVLNTLKTPKKNKCTLYLPVVMYDKAGNKYVTVPVDKGSVELRAGTNQIPAANAKVSRIGTSYGYSGTQIKPEPVVTLNGVTLKAGTDYVVRYGENKADMGTVTVIFRGNYTGTLIRNFEIVDCASSIVSGKTYQLIPKTNSKTAVCAVGGRMVNNTKVYINDRGNSEAQKFKAVKNSDGTWKFINAKCELALAVQQNSSAPGAGLVLYDQTTRPAQNWKLSKRADNSFAIINSVTGYSLATSDKSAVRGTALSMAETASVGTQRFYLVETSAVSAPFDGTKSIRAAKNKNFSVNIASASKADGANVSLYTYSNVNARKFKIIYSGGGYYRLVNVNSGLCLTIKGNSNADGANIIQSKWKGYSSQRWKITKNSDGTVTFTSMLGTVLHLSGNITAKNRNIHARKVWPTTAQKWYLN